MKVEFLIIGLLFYGVSFSQIPNYVPTDSLVGWWPFNGNANDESGNGNDGSVSFATLTTDRDDLPNSAYDFDGTSSYIEVEHDSSLNFGKDPFTLSVWVNPSKRTDKTQWIISKSSNSPNGHEFRIATGEIGTSSYLSYYFASEVNGNTTRYSIYNGYELESKPSVNPNTWTFLTIVRDEQYYWFYGNGEINSLDTSTHGTAQDHSNNIFNFVFGAESKSSSPDKYGFFHGKIDDIGIWKRALSAKEVLALYSGRPVGLNDYKNELDKLFDLYPNPTSSILQIDLKREEQSIVQLLNLQGQIIKELEAEESFDWNIEDIENGMYIIKVCQGGDCMQERVVKVE